MPYFVATTVILYAHLGGCRRPSEVPDGGKDAFADRTFAAASGPLFALAGGGPSPMPALLRPAVKPAGVPAGVPALRPPPPVVGVRLGA